MEYLPWIIAGALILWFLAANLRIVPQSEAYVIEFLGKYKTTWEAGIHFKIPLLERIAKRVTLKEQVLDAPPQPVITKDNVTMQIDAVVYFRVFNPMLFTYGAINPVNALDNLNATTLRNVVGELELDETLTSRDAINSKMALILDDATDPWGIKVIRVELKNIIPPKGIQESMEKQMKAEREKRETLLLAEAHKEADIKEAEGHKLAVVLEAEGERDARIARAEGEARAVYLAKKAEADGLRELMAAGVNDAVLRLKQFEAMQKIADGRAAKIIIPTDMVEMVQKSVTFSETASLGGAVTEPEEHIDPEPESKCFDKEKGPGDYAGNNYDDIRRSTDSKLGK
ncbi:MAG: SPFH/Band 7/PHB domain protein [Clostridiales bacterium]|nr:SPFH/Band 7/PHB domain protein [Clostridiales bacterium]